MGLLVLGLLGSPVPAMTVTTLLANVGSELHRVPLVQLLPLVGYYATCHYRLFLLSWV